MGNQLDTLNTTLESMHSSAYILAGNIIQIVICSVMLALVAGWIYYAKRAGEF